MNGDINQQADRYFNSHLGVDLATLLAPIENERPAGRYLRANGVYAAIKEARKEDDASLPMGTWERELKRADWDKVTEVAVHALANKTKDLQLVAWLLEAQLHKEGFRGIFACIALMENLCQLYWDSLFPPIEEDGDIDYRLNILHWINDKLLPLVKQIPITAAGRSEQQFHWADWEQAKRNERLKQNHSVIASRELEGIQINTFMAAMSATPTDYLRDIYLPIESALLAMEGLGKTLDGFCGDKAPSLNNLGGLLEEIQALIASELHKRGVRMSDVRHLAAATIAQDSDGAGGGSGSGAGGGGDGFGGDGPINNRADAYARLAMAADYLIHIEPHSPAPYLVKRAIEWGNLNTAELYHELFVKHQGQISIFDLLGIELGQMNS